MKHLLPDLPPPAPKEHGAWGILWGSFFSVIAITHTLMPSQLLLALAISFFYFSRQPFLSILKARGQKDQKWLANQRGWFRIFAALGWLFLFAAAYLSQYYFIVLWSLVLPPFLLLEIALMKRRKQKTFFAQLMGVMGLTYLAPLAFLLYQQHFSFAIIYIWLINIVFFTSGILFVRYQIAAMQSKSSANSEFKKYKAVMICYHFSLLIILFLILLYYSDLWGLVVAFIPALTQAVISVVGRLNFRSLITVGWLQIVQSVVFVILLALFV